MPEVADGAPRRRVRAPDPVLDDALDWELIRRRAAGARARRAACGSSVDGAQRQPHRRRAAVGRDRAPPRRRGPAARARSRSRCTGSAGPELRRLARCPASTLTLAGETNDYIGKGLVGRRARPCARPRTPAFAAEENVIVGNTVLYGATAGRAFFRGLAGERFAVRNSGASAVVEGVGDHGCEYMTGGRVVVLGPTGRNFAAGMSGGIAYVLDERRHVRRPLQHRAGRARDARASDDEAELQDLIAEHAERTGSPVAARMLDDWDAAVRRFVKVMPRDYKRALAERAAAQAAGGTGRRRAGGARSHGQLGGFLKIHRVGFDKRDPTQRVDDYERVLRRSSRRTSCADRARAAWTAACRSATRAARSAT